jgi:hypothetical protein
MPNAAVARGPREPLSYRERRLSVRYPCELDGTWKSLAASDDTTYPLKLRNISLEGVSLRVARPFDAGTLLCLEFQDPQGQHLRKLVRVVHVRPDGDHGWVHGCQFIRPLGQAELRALT